MATRLEEFAARVTREMLEAADATGWSSDDECAAARAVLERELRAFVTELCGNRDAFLDAPAEPEPGSNFQKYADAMKAAIPNVRIRMGKMPDPEPGKR